MKDIEERDSLLENSQVVKNGALPVPADSSENGKTSKRKYNSIQWVTLITLAFGNFCVGACVSLQAPFFPKEAEAKGATPTEYGLIFGVYQLIIFIVAPGMGKLVAYVPPKFILNAGIFTVGVTCILFGVLDLAPNGTPFVVLAFVVRGIEGVGAAALKTACYTIIAAQFSERMSTTFATLETFLGLGLITGPTVGGALYDVGGYGLPFFVMGALVLVDAVVIFIYLPHPEELKNPGKGNLIKFWMNPGTLVYALLIFTTFNYIGFNSATLEPHLRQFHLSGVVLGVIFALSGAVYAVSAPGWGYLCDKWFNNKFLSLIGCVFMSVSLLLVGPLPYIGFEQKLWIVIIALLLLGLAAGGKLVCTFSGSLEDTIARGFPADITTYGLISSLFASSQSLGAFVGPSIGGFLLDTIGYRYSTVILFTLELIVIILLSIYTYLKRPRRPKDSCTSDEKRHILANGDQRSYA